MLKKNALVLLGGLIGLLLSPGPAFAQQTPPLQGLFADNFTFLTPPIPAPLEVFQDLKGGRVRLADFEGRVVLLNFWATWCAPCIREMPTLDNLQAGLGDEGLAVLAVSIDGAGPEVIAPFAKRLKLEHLGLYHDPKGALFKAFAVASLPTTFLIDRQGRILGGLAGSAEWDTPEAVEFLRYYLRGGKSEAAAQ
ncbi:MAG: TlpA disulfide reductase family protein [Kiloniellales bacterium]